MVRKNTKNVNRPARKLHLTPAAQVAAQRMSAVWNGEGSKFEGFSKGKAAQ